MSGDVRQIPLTQGKFALVDEADFEWLSQWSWHHNLGYATSAPKAGKAAIRMHRLILGAAPGMLVDHINGDGLDNRKSNLRECTRQENNRNRRSFQRAGLKGVRKGSKYWFAHLCIDGRIYSAGHYATPQEAALAYDRLANKHFGEFACLNYPDRTDAPVPVAALHSRSMSDRARGICRRKHSKLTESHIPEIRRRLSEGERCSEIARAFGVGRNAIWKIKTGRTWALA